MGIHTAAYTARCTGKTGHAPDHTVRPDGQHFAMPLVKRIGTRTRTAAVAVALNIVAASAVGLGAAAGDDAVGAADLQHQFVDVVQRVSPQVVQIRTPVGLGSGIVFGTDGNVVTNAHVAGAAKDFDVTLADGARHSATLVGTDPGNDIAVVHLTDVRPAPSPTPRSSSRGASSSPSATRSACSRA